MPTHPNNYAFISYSHKDTKIARWLQHRLEQYIIPTRIYPSVNPDNLPPDNSRYIRPVFLDQTDLTTGVLADTLRENLENSKYLIVICSPNSAKSDWVSKEVQYFVESGRLEQIIPFVIDGTPYFDMQLAAGKNPEGEECMPQYLVDFTKKHPDKELLGVDMRADGMERSAMRIISRMLGVSFDRLWNRHARHVRMRFAYIVTAIILFFSFAGFFFMPMRLQYTVTYPDDGNQLLLPDNALLVIEGTSYFLGSTLDTTIILKNRSGYYRGRELPVEFHADYFEPVQTTFAVGFGFSKSDVLYLKRDRSFAVFAGKIIDQYGNPIEGAKVSVRQESCLTDADGHFEVVLAPEEQAEEQAIVIERAGFYDVYRPDECPSEDLTYIMYERE